MKRLGSWFTLLLFFSSSLFHFPITAFTSASRVPKLLRLMSTVEPHCIQSSQRRLGTRSNSVVLFVTRVSSASSAIAAICKS